MEQLMLADKITLSTGTKLVKTNFGPNGTFYIGETNDNLTAVVNTTTTKKGQSRTLFRFNVVEDIAMPAGGTVPVTTGVQVVLTNYKASSDAASVSAIADIIAMLGVEGLVSQVRRGEK